MHLRQRPRPRPLVNYWNENDETHSETILYFCVEVHKNAGVPDASDCQFFELGFVFYNTYNIEIPTITRTF